MSKIRDDAGVDAMRIFLCMSHDGLSFDTCFDKGFKSGWYAALKAAAEIVDLQKQKAEQQAIRLEKCDDEASEFAANTAFVSFMKTAAMLRDPELAWPGEQTPPDDEPADFTKGNY